MIQVRHLQKSYNSGTPITDLSCDIKRGEIVSLIGHSGVGKSTFLRCLNGLEKPDRGEIVIDGVNILAPGINVNAVRRKVGMVFQNFNLFPNLMTVENVMLAPVQLLGLSRQKAYDAGMRLLRSVGLGEKALCYPDELSGGQKQRAAIARALAMKPKIVLFDEPTSALDATMASEVLSVIRKLAAEGLTMVIVTHEMQFAHDVSTRIMFMNEGTIYESGTPEQIFEHPKREKTRAFIRRLNHLTFETLSKDFDFLQLNGEIEEFGQKQALTRKQISSVQLIFEELVMNLLLLQIPTEAFYLSFTLEHSQQHGELSLRFIFGGAPFDPMVECADTLSMTLISHTARSLTHRYEDGKNYFSCLY